MLEHSFIINLCACMSSMRPVSSGPGTYRPWCSTRYTMYGAVCAHAAEEMRKPEVR